MSRGISFAPTEDAGNERRKKTCVEGEDAGAYGVKILGGGSAADTGSGKEHSGIGPHVNRDARAVEDERLVTRDGNQNSRRLADLLSKHQQISGAT